MKKGIGKRHTNVTADAGYESEENYKGLIERDQTAYIKPQNYEKSKKRKYKSNVYLRENMNYHAESDTYICPNGNEFSFCFETKRRSTENVFTETLIYAIAYNINKLHAKKKRKQKGVTLHSLKAA